MNKKIFVSVIVIFITLFTAFISNVKAQDMLIWDANRAINENAIPTNNVITLEFNENPIIFENEHIRIKILSLVRQDYDLTEKLEITNLTSQSMIYIDKVESFVVNDISLNSNNSSGPATSIYIAPSESSEMTFKTHVEVANPALELDLLSNIKNISQTFIYSARGVSTKYTAKANDITIKNTNNANYNLEKYLTLYSDNNYDILFGLEPNAIVPVHDIYIIMNNKTNSNADLLMKSFTLNDEITPLESKSISNGLGPSYVKAKTKGFYLLISPQIYTNKESTYSFEFIIDNSNDEYDVSNNTKTVKILPIGDNKEEDKILTTGKNEIEEPNQGNTITNLNGINQQTTSQTTEGLASKGDAIVNDEKLPKTGIAYAIAIVLLVIIIGSVIFYKKYKKNRN